jgi:imidazolonepropionase-like amidohydrolase
MNCGRPRPTGFANTAAFWTIALALLDFGLCGATANAQSRQVPAAPQNETVVLMATTIHPVTGPVIDNGYIIFEKGVITAIGEGKAPNVPEAVRHNASGMHVYPGLIAAHTNLGLIEVGAVDVTHDYSELGRVKPEVRAAVAINPDSDMIPVARAGGILTALTFPSGGLASGRCSLMRMDGWTWEDLAIDDAAGLVVNWPRTEPVTSRFVQQSEDEQRKQIKEDLQAVEKLIDDAEAYLKAKNADPTLDTDMRYEAMRPMLRGEKPVFVSANMVGQIESAVAWAHRRRLKIIIVGGAQADRATDLLKQHDIPVIITGTHRAPLRRQDDYDQPFSLPAKLHEAGVRFCLATDGDASAVRNLAHEAATSAAYGLPREEALKSITLYPAEILGIDNSLGSIEVGKSATLILTTGDPLDITNDVLVAFIDGRKIDLGSRHKSLYEKYREKYRQLGLIK